jgi:hypothetical protein
VQRLSCSLAGRLTRAGQSRQPKTSPSTKTSRPIFNAKCAECHHPGEAAPFSTLTYKDVRPWAKSIKEKVVNREMPPWHADPHFGELANDRRLTPQQIEAIPRGWIKAQRKATQKTCRLRRNLLTAGQSANLMSSFR